MFIKKKRGIFNVVRVWLIFVPWTFCFASLSLFLQLLIIIMSKFYYFLPQSLLRYDDDGNKYTYKITFLMIVVSVIEVTKLSDLKTRS